MKLQLAINNCELFSMLYIDCQNRDGNLWDFLAHENQGCPYCSPSLTDGGTLRYRSKTDLLSCLDKLTEHTVNHYWGHCNHIRWCSSGTNALSKCFKKFPRLQQLDLSSYFLKWLEKVRKLDVMWDNYYKNQSNHQPEQQGAKIPEGVFYHLYQFWKTGKISCIQKKTKRTFSSY